MKKYIVFIHNTNYLSIMNKELFRNTCQDTFCTKLPVELIDEIVNFVPKCNNCKTYPKTPLNTCNDCKHKCCKTCTRKCHECDKNLCKSELCCNQVIVGRFFQSINVCNLCFYNPKCSICISTQNDNYITEMCIECYKNVCDDCSHQCCSDRVICDNCIDTSSEIYKCLCDGKVMCDECSYRCRYCDNRICGECKDLSIAYHDYKMCLECRD